MHQLIDNVFINAVVWLTTTRKFYHLLSFADNRLLNANHLNISPCQVFIAGANDVVLIQFTTELWRVSSSPCSWYRPVLHGHLRISAQEHA